MKVLKVIKATVPMRGAGLMKALALTMFFVSLLSFNSYAAEALSITGSSASYSRFEVGSDKVVVGVTGYGIEPQGGSLVFQNRTWVPKKNVKKITGEFAIGLSINETKYKAYCSVVDFKVMEKVTYYKCKNDQWVGMAGHNELFPVLQFGEKKSLSAQDAVKDIKANKDIEEAIWKLWKISDGKEIDLNKERKGVNVPTSQTTTPSTTEDLIDAAQEGDTAGVNALLDKGADVNAKDKNGATALMAASQNGHADVVKALLNKGADVNAKEKGGGTALMATSAKGHTEIVKALLNKSADVNAKDKDGGTALILASEKGHTDTVKVLLDKGADVNAKEKGGATALMYASHNGHTEIVHALLNKGADVNVKTEKGNTALMLASKKGHTGIVQLLKEAGAKK